MSLFRSTYESNLHQFSELLSICRELQTQYNEVHPPFSLQDMAQCLRQCEECMDEAWKLQSQLNAATIERGVNYRRLKAALQQVQLYLQCLPAEEVGEFLAAVSAFEGVKRAQLKEEDALHAHRNIESYNHGYTEALAHLRSLLQKLSGIAVYQPSTPELQTTRLLHLLSHVEWFNAQVTNLYRLYTEKLHQLNQRMFLDEGCLYEKAQVLRKCLLKKLSPAHAQYHRVANISFRRKRLSL